MANAPSANRSAIKGAWSIDCEVLHVIRHDGELGKIWCDPDDFVSPGVASAGDSQIAQKGRLA